jgi:hypothetical protein
MAVEKWSGADESRRHFRFLDRGQKFLLNGQHDSPAIKNEIRRLFNGYDTAPAWRTRGLVHVISDHEQGRRGFSGTFDGVWRGVE